MNPLGNKTNKMKTFIKNLSKVIMLVSIVFLVITAINPCWTDDMKSNGMLIMWAWLCLSGAIYAGAAD